MEAKCLSAGLLVLSAAILTFNTKDFPVAVLQPDELLMNQSQLQKILVPRAIKDPGMDPGI